MEWLDTDTHITHSWFCESGYFSLLQNAFALQQSIKLYYRKNQ